MQISIPTHDICIYLDGWEFTLVDKPGYTEIWNLKLNLTLKVKVNTRKRDLNQDV